ncbi:MAG: hypothetical protein B6U95_08975 [Thermofilum sp. ex4484_82]|nr:MAG: hypothetical protein B6U95_08975 [Thermofilum sp. ex4484_82]OYT36057.1 MAG: hypothetical protein B6U96_08980 [Archaeoglobales archaeon ex4484_92]RLE76409.1 MAG: hypothetical protein DRZ80_01035 [Thermoprotei archaeon]
MAWTFTKIEDYVLRRTIQKLLEEKLHSISKAEKSIMTSIAAEDYKNYLKVKLDLLGFEDAEDLIYREIKAMLEDPIKFRNKLEEWLNLWLAKWRQRVKVVFKEEQEFKVKKEVESETLHLWNSISRKKELLDLVIGSLIKSGEYCLTKTIAESIVKGELFKYSKQVSDKKKLAELIDKYPIILLKDSLRAVKVISRNKGYLVSIKVDQNMFREYVKKRGKGRLF